MTCVHRVKWSVKRPEDCRFRLSVSHYKDRIVAPEEYSGATEVTPTNETQILLTKDKTVRSDIVINPAPTETLSTTSNGQFTPSDGKVGFYQVDVDVQPDLRPLSVSENGQYSPDGFDGYSDVTVDVEPNLTSLSVTENGLYLPESGTDGFDRVSVDVPPTIPDLIPLTATANGQYVPTGHDGFSEVNVNVPTGGGGGLTLLDTINVNGVNGVQVDIDASWFDDADYVMMVPDLTFSRNDWPYIVQDAMTGGAYASSTPSMGVQQSLFLGMAGSKLWGVWFRDSQLRPQPYEPTSYFYWYLYSASNTMTGTIKIYGIKIPT